MSRSGFTGALRLWVLGYQAGSGDGADRVLEAAAAAFARANPAIRVELVGYANDPTGFADLTEALEAAQAGQGDRGVDVVRLPPELLPPLARAGQLAPIDDALTADDRADIPPQLLDGVRIDRRAYAWPLAVSPVALYLNLDLFAERGVDPPGARWTYDEFVEAARRLTFTRENGERVYGYGAVVDPGVLDTWPFILGDAGPPLSPDHSRFAWNTPVGAGGLEKLVALVREHRVTPPDFGAQTVADVTDAFRAKTLAMHSAGSGAAVAYRATGPSFDVRPMPVGASGNPATAGTLALLAVAASGDPLRRQAAMDLARYLTGAQVGRDAPGYYPAPGARRSVVVGDPLDKFSPLVASCYVPPAIPEWPRVRTILHTSIQDAIFGKVSPEDALRAAEQEVNDVLSRSRG